MKFSTTLIALFATFVAAVPARPANDGEGEPPAYPPSYPGDVCGALIPQCCQIDVVSMMDFGCTDPYADYFSGADLMGQCNEIGKIGKCCAMEVLEVGGVCLDVAE